VTRTGTGFSLASTTTVVLTVNAQFPVQTLIIQDHTCPFPTILTNVSGPACTDVVTSTTLSAGDYVAFVGFDFFSSSDILTCGVANTYHASLSEGEPPVGCTLDSGVSDNSIGLGNFGGGETLYLHRFGGGGQAQVNSISMAGAPRASPAPAFRTARRRRSGSSRIRTTTASRTTPSRSPRRTSSPPASTRTSSRRSRSTPRSR
jgi:hypothetical protein